MLLVLIVVTFGLGLIAIGTVVLGRYLAELFAAALSRAMPSRWEKSSFQMYTILRGYVAKG